MIRDEPPQSMTATWGLARGRSNCCRLYEAAHVLLAKISRTPALRRWGLAIARRIGFEKATVAVARKLAVLLYPLW